MKIIDKNILTVESGIICQSVNCQGKMNSGLAKQIREKWPIVYDDYIEQWEALRTIPFKLLGSVGVIGIKETNYQIKVANIFGQLFYGYDGQRYTDYCALDKAFYNLNNDVWKNEQFYFPFNFGCDRGGADWNIVSRMISYYFPGAIICKLPENRG